MKKHMYSFCICLSFCLVLFACDTVTSETISGYSGEGEIQHKKQEALGADGIILNLPRVNDNVPAKLFNVNGLPEGRVPYTFYFVSENAKSLSNCFIKYSYLVDGKVAAKSQGYVSEMRMTGRPPLNEFYFEKGERISVPEQYEDLGINFTLQCPESTSDVSGYVMLKSGGSK